MSKKIILLSFGIAFAASLSPALAADLPSRVAAPAPVAPAFDPLAPVVEIVTLPFKVVGAVVNAILPPPAPVVAKN